MSETQILNREQVVELVKKLVLDHLRDYNAEVFAANPQITDATKLMEDLQMDILNVSEIAMAIAEEHDVELPVEFEESNTFGELVAIAIKAFEP